MRLFVLLPMQVGIQREVMDKLVNKLFKDIRAEIKKGKVKEKEAVQK